jgi:hypothetical protein
MNFNRCIAWILVVAAVLLLFRFGSLDLVVILLPLSLLLACGIGCAGHDNTRLTEDIKKG